MQDEDVKKVDGTEGEEVVVATDEVVNADAEVSTEEEVVAQEPGDEIGMEVHDDGDQFFRFEKGDCKVVINEVEYTVGDGDAVVVPAGAQHNVVNTSSTESLKLYTIYTPPHHKDGVVRKTRAEAEADGPEFDGVTTE